MDIIHTLTIDAAPSHVLKALTTQTGLAGWWTPETTAQPHVDGINRHVFGAYGSLAMRVEEISAGKIIWSPIDAPDEWKATKIAFSITPQEAGTTLEFRQGPFSETYEQFGMFNYNWACYMRSIKLYAETGTGEPFGSDSQSRSRTAAAH